VVGEGVVGEGSVGHWWAIPHLFRCADNHGNRLCSSATLSNAPTLELTLGSKLVRYNLRSAITQSSGLGATYPKGRVHKIDFLLYKIHPPSILYYYYFFRESIE